MTFAIALLFWLVYFMIWIGLFFLNFSIFKKTFGKNLTKEIIEDHNTALGSIVKWQLIWQSIMIGSLIYFFGTTLDKVMIDGKFMLNNFLINITDLVLFWLVGIVLFQTTLFVVGKVISLEKDIMIDQNEAVGRIIEWLLIAVSVLLSVAIFSY